MNYFALTIRKSVPVKTVKQSEAVVKELNYYIKRLKTDYPTSDVRFHWECVETNGRFNIHIHGLIKSPADFILLKPAKGYYAKIELCDSATAWNVYITKDDDTPERIIKRISHSTGATAPAASAVRKSEDDLEYREHVSFMNKLKVINLFKSLTKYHHNKVRRISTRKSLK